MIWDFTPAGFVSGPRTLKMVRMPISRRGPMAYFMAWCIMGAKRNPMPTSFRHSSTPVRRHLDVDAQGLEHVGAAALARDRAVAVLGHGHARPGDDESGGRGDIERMRHVAAGAAGVDLVRRV